MSVDAFANGGMNVTGLRLVDFTDPTVKSYLKGWSVVNRNVKVLGSTSSNKIIEVIQHGSRLLHTELYSLINDCTHKRR